MKHIIDIIRQIPTDIVNHIIERNVIANATNVFDNVYLQYINQLWKTYFDSSSSSSLDCAYCRQELINNFKAMQDLFIQVYRERKMLEKL